MADFFEKGSGKAAAPQTLETTLSKAAAAIAFFIL